MTGILFFEIIIKYLQLEFTLFNVIECNIILAKVILSECVSWNSVSVISLQ